MIIRSLCYFPPVKGNRSENAGRSIRDVLNRFRKRLLAISLAAFAMQSLPLIIPFVFRRYLPDLMEEKRFTNGPWSTLVSVLVLTVIVATLRSMAAYYFLSQAGRTGHQLVASLRELAFAQLMRIPVSYVERRGSGRILLRFIGDTDALRNWFSKTGPRLVADSATAALIGGSLIWVNWQLSLVLLIPLGMTSVVIATYAGTIRQKTRNARGRQAQFVGFVQSQLDNIRSSKLTDAQDHGRMEFRSHLAEVSFLNADRDRDAAKLEALAEFAIYLSLPLLVLAGLPLVWSNKVEPGALVIFVWLTLHLMALLRSSFSAFVIQQKALVSIQRLYVLLSRSAERGRSVRSVSSEFRTFSVIFDNQRYDFSSGIHEMPERVDAAQLISLLHGFERSSDMTLAIDDIPVDQIDVGQRRRLIGYFPVASDVDELLVGSGALRELKILIFERGLASLSAFEQTQFKQLAERSIVLFAMCLRQDRHRCVVLQSDSGEPTQAV